MFFRTFEGALMLSLHQPNGGKKERAHFFSVEEKENGFNLTESAK
jgi:hypothetical protein